MSSCNRFCLKYKKSRDYSSENSKQCKNCDIFMEWEGARCPCCEGILKTTPRNSKRRKIYREIRLQ